MPELSNSLADYDFYRNDRVKAAVEALSKKPEPTIMEGMKAAFRTEMTIKSMIDSSPVPLGDEEALTRDEFKELTKDVPDEYHHVFTRGINKAHRQQIKSEIQQELKDNEMLDGLGWKGFGLRLGASIIDPPQLVASSLTGGFGAAGKVGKLSKFVQGGLVAGVSNAAIESYLNRQQYTRDADDIAIAGLMGFGIGGLAGTFSKAEERALRAAAHKGADDLYLRGVERTGAEHGVSLTEAGQAFMGGSLSKREVQQRVNGLMNDVFGREVERAPIGLRLIVADMVKDGTNESLFQARQLVKEQAMSMAEKSDAGRSNLLGQLTGLLNNKVDDAAHSARGNSLLSKEEIRQQRIQRKLQESKARAATVEEAQLNALNRRMQEVRNLKKETDIQSAFSKLKESGAVKNADDLISKAMGEAGGGLNQMQRAMLERLIKNGDQESAIRMARKFASDILHETTHTARKAAKAADEAKAWKAMGKFRARDLAKGKADAQETLNKLEGKKGNLPEDVQPKPKEEAVPDAPKADEPVVEEKLDAPDRGLSVGSIVRAIDKEGEEFTGAIVKVGKRIVVEDIRTGAKKALDNEDILDVHYTKAEREMMKPEKVDLSDIDAEDFGFGEGSVGAAQVKGTTIDTSDMMYLKIPGTNIRLPLRFDLFAITQRSEIPAIKKIGRMLFADGVGGSDMGNTAAELAEMEYKAFKGRWESVNYKSYQEWLLDNPHPASKRFNNEAWLKYNEQVAAATRGLAGEYHPSVKAAAAHARVLMDEMLEAARKHGVQGAEDIKEIQNYLTRRFHHDNIAVTLRDLAEKFGGDHAKAIGAVERLIAGAIRSVRDIEPEKAQAIASAYFKTVRSLRFNPLMNRTALGNKELALLRAQLKEIKVKPEDIEDVLEMVTGKPKELGDGGNMPRFKHRTTLDENYSMTIEGVTLKMTDLFDNNMDSLMNLYTKQMTGAIGMAKMGIKSHADFDDMLKAAKDYAADHVGLIDADRANKHLKYLEDGYKQIMGIPTDETMGTGFARSMKVLRDFNFFRMMGQAGFAQVAEIGNIMGQVGFRTFVQHTPALGELIEMAKGGKLDDQLGRDIHLLWGVGSEMLTHPSMKELDNLTHSHALSRMENIAEQAKWLTGRVSGMASINNIMRQMSYRMIVQKMLDQATGGVEKLTNAQLKRLATAGLGDDMIDSVFESLKKYGKKDELGKVTQIDHDAWIKADPDSFERFRLSVFREARRSVQEHAVGETHPWMHTMLGQIVFQFRSFMLVSHSKQFLHGLAHADSQTVAMWGYSMLFAGMAYTAQNAINHAGDEEQLNKKLSPEAIGKAAFSRAGFSSLAPMGIDTVTHFTSYEPFFSGSRSTGLESAVTNPTFDLGRRWQNTLSNLGRSVFDAEYMATQQDIKDGLGGFVPNYLLVRNFINAAANEFPKKNPLRQPVE